MTQQDKIGVPLKLYETHIPVTDIDRARQFYCDIIGLKFAFEQKERNVVFLWIGGREQGMLGLWGPGSDHGPRDGQYDKRHFAFSIPLDDLLAAPAKLQALGIDCKGFKGETDDLPSVIGWMPSAQIYFFDPDGHSLEFITLLADKPNPNFIGTWSQWQAQTQHHHAEEKSDL